MMLKIIKAEEDKYYISIPANDGNFFIGPHNISYTTRLSDRNLRKVFIKHKVTKHEWYFAKEENAIKCKEELESRILYIRMVQNV